MLRLLFSVCLFVSSLAKAESLQIQFPVEKYQLKNGLTVLLHQDRTIPMVSYHTWYRVGSKDESPGVTGAAHMLEHMMFKGAKKYSDKDFDRILHENGISNNAFTTWDYTGFYENLPSSKLELIMDVEVDRMRFLNLRPEDLKSELQVVGEERRWRVDNNPASLLREAMMEVIYTVHPYRWPVIGWMKDIQAYTSEKLRHFYDSYYLPNNAVLVLAGDFEIDKAKSLIEKYYSQLESRPIPERKIAIEPEQKKERRKTITSNVQNSNIIMTFPTVKAGHEDAYALDLLGMILGTGSSSRLHKQLVFKDQVATGVYAYSSANAEAGLFSLGSAMKPGQATNKAEDVFVKAIEKIQKQLVSEKELQKAKNILLKEHVDGLTTIDGKAQSLAVNEIIYGDYKRLFTDIALYDKVTTSDIKRVALKYLVPTKKVVAILNPKGSKNGDKQ